MIEEVSKTVYRSSDGSMWDDRELALRQERRIILQKSMRHHFYACMDVEEILDTLAENWDLFRNLFNREDLNG